MRIFLITYDLANPGQNYERLLQKIKGYNSWARLGGSSYLVIVEPGVTPAAVRDQLLSVIDKNDKLFVGVCPVPSAWAGLPNDVAQWILENQPKYS